MSRKVSTELLDMRDRLKGVPKPKKAPVKIVRRMFTDKLETPEALKSVKLERVFHKFFDMNKNNVIDWNDFETLSHRITELRGENSTESTIVQEALRVIWKGIVKDIKNIDITDESDLEVEITLEEWKALWGRQDPSKTMVKWQWDYLKYMFFLMDTSGDKRIDKEEYRAAMELYGVTNLDADFAFDKFAIDNDGNPVASLDYGAFVKLWVAYFSSGDKAIAGNYLFGI